VLLVHIKDEIIGSNGRLDILKLRPLAHLGYYDYTTVDSVFEMVIPGENKDLLRGLEGAVDRPLVTPGGRDFSG
jgi:hypothetical protein